MTDPNAPIAENDWSAASGKRYGQQKPPKKQETDDNNDDDGSTEQSQSAKLTQKNIIIGIFIAITAILFFIIIYLVYKLIKVKAKYNAVATLLGDKLPKSDQTTALNKKT